MRLEMGMGVLNFLMYLFHWRYGKTGKWCWLLSFLMEIRQVCCHLTNAACPVPLVPRAQPGNWCQSWELRPELQLSGLFVIARNLRGTSLKLYPCSY